MSAPRTLMIAALVAATGPAAAQTATDATPTPPDVASAAASVLGDAAANSARPDTGTTTQGGAAAPVAAKSGDVPSGTIDGTDEAALPDDATLRARAQNFFEPIPLAATPPTGTTMTRAKIDLGKMLFFDPRMSRSGVFSCQSCHNIGMGGVDALETSIGHGWQQGPRNSPTMLNAVFNAAQFWDGRAADLAEQAKGPVEASVEMNNTPENLLATINSMPEYVSAFADSFPGEQEPVSFDNFATAIEAFETTLLTPNAPFDQYLQGVDAALDDSQKRGLVAFMDNGCVTCHAGVNLGGQDYYTFGVVEAPSDEVRPESDPGRFTVTNTEGDEYMFRAAPLRNVALTPPYFHSGKVWDLTEAVKVMSSAQLGTELTDAEASDITAFLESLTGEQPQIVHPTLPPRTADTPRPSAM